MVEVVTPCLQKAIKETQNQRVGVIGTSATMQSKIYSSTDFRGCIVKRNDNLLSVFSGKIDIFGNFLDFFIFLYLFRSVQSKQKKSDSAFFFKSYN